MNRLIVAAIATSIVLSAFALSKAEAAESSIRLHSRAVNSGGVSFASSGNVTLGATLGQGFHHSSICLENVSLASGFWNLTITAPVPSPSLFLFK